MLAPAVDSVISDPAFDPELRLRIQRWAQRTRFRRYLFDHASKIAKKLRPARSLEDLRDVGVELFAARIFLNVGCSVTPEPRHAGPDLLVVVGRESFYCEVARIREAPLQDEWDSLISKLKERAEPLQQSVRVQLELVRLSAENLILCLVGERFEEFVRAIRKAGSLSLEQETVVELAFVPRGTLQLRATPLSSGSRGYFECPVSPVFFTQREYRKLSDILCAKLPQLRPGVPNVLYLRSNSSTHAQIDLAEAIKELALLAATGDDAFFARKGLTNAQEFQTAASRLTAVVLDDLWKPVDSDQPSARVWHLEGAASALSNRVQRKLEAACRVRW